MLRYTIGIVFGPHLKRVLLIKKIKPDWQAGKYNFPGGKTEIGETQYDCVSREFLEETNLNIPPDDWRYIGVIEGKDYQVDILTVVHNPEKHGYTKNLTEESLHWSMINNLPSNIISNLSWLIPFALNMYNSNDTLHFGIFTYT